MNHHRPTDDHDRQDELRQELLEYHFECHPDMAGIAQRLENDAELAALYEQVKHTAALLADAATAEAPHLQLSAPAEDRGGDGPATARRFGFRQVWRAAAALFLVAMIPAVGIYLQRTWRSQEVETSKVSVLVSAPPAIPDGAPLQFHVETHDLARRPTVTQVDWKVLDEAGTVLSESTALCDGRTDITVAGTLNKPRKLVVTARLPGNGFQKTVEQPIHPSQSAPLIHVTSDKPAYRPGEAALLRIACLDRLTLRSVDRIGLRCRIVDPKNAALQQRVLAIGKGVGAWTWQIPPSAIGGNYALEVRDADDQHTMERFEFLVRNFQPPKLAKKIILDRQTYAPGSRGAADLQVTRASGGPAAGAKVRATLLVDGEEAWTDDGVLDSSGRAVFRFEVPANVRKGAGRFVARITDGGHVETGLEPFVIPTGAVEVMAYPEGGELIAGTPNRVYAQVKDPLGRPLSGAGRVVDDQGQVVAEFTTLHMGRTRFAFTPVLGRRYTLELQQPRAKKLTLPVVQDVGAVLQPVGDHFAAGEPARIRVFTAGRGPWIATVFCRGVLVGQQSILKRGLSELAIPLVDEASGVVRVTVFDHQLRPVAERLVQRDGKRSLQVTVSPELARVAPGAKQKVKIKATDETGEPVSGILGVTVADRTVAAMLDYIRVGLDDQRHLFTDVEKPDDKVEELLAGHAERRRNVDLLLGCLGWRRYVWRGETEEKALLAAGGEWARSLEQREGRAAAPLVTDSLAEHQAELRVVRWSRQRAWELLVGFANWSLLAFGLLALLHGLVWLARRARLRWPILVSSLGAVAAALLCTMILWPHTLATGFLLESVDASAARPTASAPQLDMVDFFAADPAVSTGVFSTVLSREAPDGVTVIRTGGGDAYIRDFDVQVAQGAVVLPGIEGGIVANLDLEEDLTIEANADADQFFMSFNRREAGEAGRAVRLIDSYGLRVYGNAWGFQSANPMDLPFGTANRPGARFGRGSLAYGGFRYGSQFDNQARVTRMVDDINKLPQLRNEFRELSLWFDAPERRSRLTTVRAEIERRGALVDWLYRRYPIVLGTLHPKVAGAVRDVEVSRRLVTIAVQQGADLLKPGFVFAVFDDQQGLKAQATVTDIDASKQLCYARLEPLPGRQVQPGDRAATDLVDQPRDTGEALLLSPGQQRQIETILANPVLSQLVHRYTHTAAESRQRFVETLFWRPYLVTDEKGEATIEFDISDAVTTWEVVVDAHGGGRVGQGKASFESFLPFALTAKVPTRASEGDRLQIPISIVADDADQQQATIELATDGPIELKGAGRRTVKLTGGRGRVLAEIAVGQPAGSGAAAGLVVRGEVQGASDTLRRRFVVVPRGFPHRVDHAGTLAERRELTLAVPDPLARRTGQWTLRFYPSPLANLEEALQGMLREPSGCFEQVSSSNYPNVMILSLLESSGDNIPALAAKAQDMLARGYRKLTGYEVSGGGFEWWGKDPAHAALTAYGLMQFTDMARVFDGVDPQMVARTRGWLLGKRDGKGGFVTGQGRYGHFMGGSAEARSAYIAYALLYAGEDPARMTAELEFLEQRAQRTGNAYELAVIACALAKAGRPAAAQARQRLAAAQAEDGSLLGTGSITGSGPRDLRIETTAFAVLAWLSGKGHDPQVGRAVRFLEQSRQGGGHFGATQATVMALKALTAYLASSSHSVRPGILRVFVGDQEVAKRELFGTEKRTITIEHLERHLLVGKNKVRIELSGGNRFPFSSEWSYRADLPASSPDCVLDLGTFLSKKVIEEGATTALHAVVKNKTDRPVANPMVLVGLPAGLHVDSRILDDLEKAATIAAWELTDQMIVLYLRGLQPHEARDITIDLVGRIPGTSKGPASRAYLYYTGAEKHWAHPLDVTVTPGK